MKILKKTISFILLMAMMPVLMILGMLMPAILIIRGIPGFIASIGSGIKNWIVDLNDNPVATIKYSIIVFVKFVLYIIILIIISPIIIGIACNFGGRAYCGY